MTTRRLSAVLTMAVLFGVVAQAQQAPEPRPAQAKAVKGKTTEATTPSARRGASASPLQTAAAIEQILRKLRDEGAPAPARRRSRETTPARLRVTWRLTLNWPAALTAAQAP
jgi:predicted deacylase